MNNLNNLSDEELDKLFRHSAYESEVEFDEGAWDKMKGILEEKQPSKKPLNWNKYAISILALLFIGSSLFYFGKKEGFIANSTAESKVLPSENESKAGNIIAKQNQDNLTQSEKNKNITEKSKPEVDNLEREKIVSETAINETSDNAEKAIKSKEEIKPSQIITNQKPIENEKIKSEINNDVTNGTGTKPLSKNKALNNKKRLTDTITSNENNSQNENEKPNIKISNSKIEANNLNNTNALNEKNSSSKPILRKIKENVGHNNSQKNTFGSNIDVPINTENITKKSKSNGRNEVIGNTTISNNTVFENNTSLINTNNKLNKNEAIKSEPTVIEPVVIVSEKSIAPRLNYNYNKPNFIVEVHELNLPIPLPIQEPFYKKGLSIRLGISPDISKVGSNSITKIGSNYGSSFEYRFNNRIVLQAGVLMSKKYYDAYPAQYNWIWGKPASNLVEINAICKMIDIPINIRYDIVTNTKTRIFASSGLTSYIMKNEKYHYDYEDNSNPNIKRHDWEGKTGTYKSSNINISIGFEKQMAKALSMQVEPFGKIPLKSIGFGKVPLITYGLMFSANYQLRNLMKK